MTYSWQQWPPANTPNKKKCINPTNPEWKKKHQWGFQSTSGSLKWHHNVASIWYVTGWWHRMASEVQREGSIWQAVMFFIQSWCCLFLCPLHGERKSEIVTNSNTVKAICWAKTFFCMFIYCFVVIVVAVVLKSSRVGNLQIVPAIFSVAVVPAQKGSSISWCTIQFVCLPCPLQAGPCGSSTHQPIQLTDSQDV